MAASKLLWIRSLVAVMLATLVAVLSLSGSTWLVAAQDATTASVSIVNFGFNPVILRITVGTTVTWTNDGVDPHTVTADDGAFDSGRLDPGTQFSQTFDQPGTFSYHCTIHPQMQASVIVTGNTCQRLRPDNRPQP